MRKAAGPLILALFLTLWSASPAQALCQAMTTQEQVDAADAVALRTILMFWPDFPFAGDGPSATVAVTRYFKGADQGTIIVQSSSSTLGFLDIEDLGKRHILFLHDKDGQYVSNVCAGTRRLDNPDAGVFLNEIVAITGPGSPPIGAGAWPPMVLPLAALALLAFSWFAAGTSGRRRRGT